MDDEAGSEASNFEITELERRNERLKLFINMATDFRHDLANRFGLNLTDIVLHEDRLREVVEEYFVAVEEYKRKNGYPPGGRAGPSKVAALSVFFILANQPFEPRDKENVTTELRLLNEHFAWRVAYSLLKLDPRKLASDDGIRVSESIIHCMERAPRQLEQAETWNVALKHHLERAHCIGVFEPMTNDLEHKNASTYD